MSDDKPKGDDKPKASSKPCPDCGGRGTIPWGTSDLKCSACDGKGTQSSG